MSRPGPPVIGLTYSGPVMASPSPRQASDNSQATPGAAAEDRGLGGGLSGPLPRFPLPGFARRGSVTFSPGALRALLALPREGGDPPITARPSQRLHRPAELGVPASTPVALVGVVMGPAQQH